MHRHDDSSVGSIDQSADRRKVSEEMRRKNSALMRLDIQKSIVELEADKN